MRKMTFVEFRELKAKKVNRKGKLKEFLQLFFSFSAIAGFMIIAGTGGASDLDNISYLQVKIQLTIGLIVFVLSVILAKKLGKRKEEEE